MATAKYIPRPYGLDLEFFHLAIQTGKVHVQQCVACGHYQHPPRRWCALCTSPELHFVPSTGRGEVYSWTVSHFTTDSGWEGDVPYASVVVELSEGPRLVGAFTGDPTSLTLGQSVSIRPEAKSDDFAFLWVDG